MLVSFLKGGKKKGYFDSCCAYFHTFFPLWYWLLRISSTLISGFLVRTSLCCFKGRWRHNFFTSFATSFHYRVYKEVWPKAAKLSLKHSSWRGELGCCSWFCCMFIYMLFGDNEKQMSGIYSVLTTFIDLLSCVFNRATVSQPPPPSATGKCSQRAGSAGLLLILAGTTIFHTALYNGPAPQRPTAPTPPLPTAQVAPDAGERPKRLSRSAGICCCQ